MEYMYVATAAISAGVAIWKMWQSGKKGKILSAVIKGIEDSAKYMPKADLTKVKSAITNKALKYGVEDALHKLVKLVTRKE